MNCNQAELDAALKILNYSRRRIRTLCPLLLLPIHAFREKVLEMPGPMSTDGVHLWFWPAQVLDDFRQDHDLPAQKLLHITLHCLLGHLPMREEQRRGSASQKEAAYALSRFDAAADLNVTYLMGRLCGNAFFTRGMGMPMMDEGFHQLYKKMCSPEFPLHYEQPAAACYMDDHELWAPKGEAVCIAIDGSVPDWNGLLGQMLAQANASPLWGTVAGALEREYRFDEESPISYTQFLRRFACIQERMQTDPDSIDTRWYHLGLELYGDIPFLEPVELSEPPSATDLVIAMDTSGSCDGEVCQRFLRETASLLRDISAGASSFRVLLLQCDAEIQYECLLTSPDQLDQLPQSFYPQGFGGTDFTPVFQRVEQLRGEGALPHVRGLLYLSDGCGYFPETAPDYPVCFLIPDNEWWGIMELPEWVTAVQINPNDFMVKEASL